MILIREYLALFGDIQSTFRNFFRRDSKKRVKVINWPRSHLQSDSSPYSQGTNFNIVCNYGHVLVIEKSEDSERVRNTTLGTRLESIPYITQPYVLSSYCGIYIPDSSYQKKIICIPVFLKEIMVLIRRAGLFLCAMLILKCHSLDVVYNSITSQLSKKSGLLYYITKRHFLT